MKHLLLTTIAAVVLVGCGESQQSAPTPEAKPVEPVAEAAKPEPPTAKAPDISILDAAFGGNIEAVKQHIAAGADVNAKYEGWTPLHTAVEGGHKEIAELLIDNGADVNAMDKDGRTPLHFASAKGHKEIAELLIAEGADVNVIIQSGSFQEMTPLDMATDKNRTETEDLLRKHGGKTGEELDALFDAAKTGNVTDAKKAIADDLDVNARDDEGMTPLLYAVWEGHREIVELLLANGADTSAKNPDGQTPLDLAIEYDDTEIIDLLRKHQEPETMPSLIYSKDKLTINVPFDFRFTTKAGKSYTVEATGDLLKWYKVETIRGTGSEVKFTDIRKALFERQYYRVKVVD